MKKRNVKYDTINNWLRCGLNQEDVDTVWDRYSNSTCCEWCYQYYKSQRDKQMDHCHNTGSFRNILCQSCNNWRKEPINICKSWNKRESKYRYNINIFRDKKRVLGTARYTLEEAEEVLEKFKLNNWWYFPFEDVWN